ncbi:MAG: flagellar export protein FliJ [Pseudomonadales bacterium]|nr:flagellar export protein FliJ [Pseudomonadales bacterium]
MRRSQRLQPILKIAALEADKAARAMAYMEQKLTAETDKQNLLHQHLQEYRQQLQDDGRAGINAQSLRMNQQFLANIEQAIKQQKRQIELVGQQLQQVRQIWQQRDIRRQSLEKMIEKLHRQEKQLQERMEQKAQDEQTQNLRFYRKS